MSFTPARTAEMAMNSALKASAISRASVVLPEPGGPHRIIECGFFAANATARGLPGSSRCFWPTTSRKVLGRRRSASGAAGFSTANRSAADDIGARRRRKAEKLGAELGVTLELGQANRSVLPEVVDDLQRRESARVEAELELAECRILVLWRGAEPLQTVRGRQRLPLERALDFLLAGEQRRRRRSQRAIVVAHHDLV